MDNYCFTFIILVFLIIIFLNIWDYYIISIFSNLKPILIIQLLIIPIFIIIDLHLIHFLCNLFIFLIFILYICLFILFFILYFINLVIYIFVTSPIINFIIIYFSLILSSLRNIIWLNLNLLILFYLCLLCSSYSVPSSRFSIFLTIF